MLRTLTIGAILSCLAYVGVTATYPFNPALRNTDQYQRSYRMAGDFPFLTSYLVLAPERSYPLVLVLHGGHKRSIAAYVAAEPEFRRNYPAYVVMPMAVRGQPWFAADKETGTLGPSKSLAIAIDIVRDVIDDYPIDRARKYVTGSSNGAVGTFATMRHYSDLFAAGIAVNGWWPVEDAASLSASKLAIYHGVNDRINSIARMRELIASIRGQGGQPVFVEMANVGHDSRPAYSQRDLWAWMFAQRNSGR